MQTRHDHEAMAHELREHGFDNLQAQRFDLIFEATKAAVICLMCARHDTDASDLLEAIALCPRLADEAQVLVRRIELTPEFVGYVHGGWPF